MIALYPGAFKPPHRGHFNVVKSLLDGSYNGTIYNKDDYKEKASSLFQGQSEKKPNIDKVVIFIGGGERNGITKAESMDIWNIYSKHLGNVEIVDGQKNPMFAAKDYARENPNEEFVAVTGIRGEEDFVDLRRVTTFNNVDNVQGLALASKPGSGVRATDFRNSILAGNLDKVIDFFPEELSREEILGILTDLKDKIVAEILGSSVSNFLDEYFISQDIKEEVEEPKKPQLAEYIASLLEYMLDQGMNITPLPEVKIRQDEAEAANFFGRTAYYDPNVREIVLYVSGRHPKDIVRSFSHEMVHHMQNIEGRLQNISTSNTNEDDNLLELEKEAYLTGNITFRNWEDNLKNSSNTLNESVMAEGRYDKITNQASSAIFNKWKKDIEAGKTQSTYSDQFESNDLLFDVEATLALTKGIKKLNVDGGADYSPEGEYDDMILVTFEIDPDLLPNFWEEISMNLKDVIRHEIEHLTHSDSDNLRTGKFIDDDSHLRALIKSGVLGDKEYFRLAKEVDAMIQGMYFRAKKEKRPFADVVNTYLNSQKGVSQEDKEEILTLWRKRLPALGIKQRL